MAISGLDEYLELEANPPIRIGFFKTLASTVAGRPYDAWVVGTLGGTAPTTAVAPSKTTAGALGIEELRNVSYALRIMGANLSSNQAGSFMLVDRLSHQGGLSAIVTGSVATNLPTAALTRYTNGVGVMLGLTIYTQIGTTATTITITYTNQDGTGSRVTPAITFGGTGFREAGRLIMCPLQAGDTGVRSVQSVNVVATTGTAGAYGVTLYKPLAMYVIERPGGQQRCNLFDGMGGFARDIDANPCLGWIYTPNTAATVLGGTISLAEAT